MPVHSAQFCFSSLHYNSLPYSPMAYEGKEAKNIIFEPGTGLMGEAWKTMFIDSGVTQRLANVGIELVKFNCHPGNGETGIHVTVTTGGNRYNINLDANANKFLLNQSNDVKTAIQNGAFSGLLQELKNTNISRTFMLNMLVRAN